MADPGTPDWWLDRLYGKLRDRQERIKGYDRWYSGEHPAPNGNEKADLLLQRLLETVGLNILARVTDAGHERIAIEGFKVNGEHNEDVWKAWQGNNFDAAFRQVVQEQMALSEALVLVDPNKNAAGVPTMTPEHPLQALVEDLPAGRGRHGIKAYVDDTQGAPIRYAHLYLGDKIETYAAPTRVGGWALRPSWERQESLSGDNPLGECPLVPFRNRPRMLKESVPEWWPALETQRRINKTLLDRMAMQDEGAFKALWATGLAIPVDPETNEPVEPFKRALDRAFVNENPEGKFGQFEAEDIRQMLLAVMDDIKAASILVPTPPDQLLGELVNVSEGGLEAARDSLTRRVNLHKAHIGESAEIVARLLLKAQGKSVPNAQAMETNWADVENVTLGARADAGQKWSTLGVPLPVLWEKFLGASPDEVTSWLEALDDRAAREASAGVKAIQSAAAGGA